MRHLWLYKCEIYKLYFGKIPPYESASYVFCNEVYYFLPIVRFPWLTYVDLYYTNWLNCSSINSRALLNYNYLEIMLAVVTYVSLQPRKLRLLNYIWVNFKSLFLVHHYVSKKLGYLERWGKRFFLKCFEDLIGSHKISSFHIPILNIPTFIGYLIASCGFKPN